MRQVVYMAGTATIADGVMHLLFPVRWSALWIVETRNFLPQLGHQLEQCYQYGPMDIRRAQGSGWVVLGELMLWWAGSVDAAESQSSVFR